MHRWFWKCGRLFFFAGKLLYGPFFGIFWGGQDFFDPLNFPERSEGQFRGQISRGPLKISRKMAHKVICPKTKNNLSNFQNQRCIGIFMSLCDQLPSILSLYSFFSSFFYCFNNDMCSRENPAKYPSLAKNPPKYTTAYIVQQSNCRWHGKPTCFSS
jgi:hypothetical protein